MLNPKRVMDADGLLIGNQYPVYIVGEIGINHNGDICIAQDLMLEAKNAGFDAVKFQKRSPYKCVPRDQWYHMKDTPWGRMPYIDYRERMEFGEDQWQQIFTEGERLGIDVFASVWDEESVDFMMQYHPVLYKVPSAKLTDEVLLEKLRELKRSVILSTGMSTWDQVKNAVDREWQSLGIMHCTSTYPCPLDELNLRVIDTMLNIPAFQKYPIGYSGHEVGLATTVAAVALGASMVERHITLDRSMWGSDQAASVEPAGMRRLVKDIRNVELALGDGKKVVYASEQDALVKLRGLDTT